MKPKLYTFYHTVFVAILIALFIFGCKKDDNYIPLLESGTIHTYGAVNNFVTWTFVMDKSGYFGDGFTTYKIEGYFRVKRVANN